MWAELVMQDICICEPVRLSIVVSIVCTSSRHTAVAVACRRPRTCTETCWQLILDQYGPPGVRGMAQNWREIWEQMYGWISQILDIKLSQKRRKAPLAQICPILNTSRIIRFLSACCTERSITKKSFRCFVLKNRCFRVRFWRDNDRKRYVSAKI